MIKNLLHNWKTTSAGMGTLITAVVHLVFAVHDHTATENIWITHLVAMLTGIGLLSAGDASKSAADDQALAAKVEDVKAAVRTGDTSILDKPATEPPKP